MSKRTEVALENGVLAFDGDVLEAFGFTTGGSQRTPVSQIEAMELNRGILTIRSAAGNVLPLSLSLGGDEAESAELVGFLDELRAAAPNLEEL